MNVQFYGIWERSILKTLYMCEICGRQSEDKEEIEKCENVGVPVPLVKVGDLIFFKDCKETPILFENEKILTEISNESSIYAAIRKARIFLNQLLKYKVQDIIVDGHEIEYRLQGIKGESVNFSASDDFKSFWRYPVIYGNDFMQKILDKYN